MRLASSKATSSWAKKRSKAPVGKVQALSASFFQISSRMRGLTLVSKPAERNAASAACSRGVVDPSSSPIWVTPRPECFTRPGPSSVAL